MAEKKETIAVDIDEVKAEFIDGFLNFYNAKYGKEYKKEDIFTYDLENVFGTTREQEMKEIHEFGKSQGFANLMPIKGAIEAINILKKNYNLVVVTSRPKNFSEDTKKWISQHFKDSFSDIHFTNHHAINKNSIVKEKVDICKEIGAKIIIEDSLSNALACSAIGMKAYLFERPWNKKNRPKDMPSNIIVVNSWDEIVKELM